MTSAYAKFTCPHCDRLILAFYREASPMATLESSAPFLDVSHPTQTTVAPKSFWASDGVNSSIIGLFAGLLMLGLCWGYDLPAAWAVVTALLVGIGMYALKVVLHRPPGAPLPLSSKPQKHIVQVEQITEDNQHWLIAEFDQTISLSDLQAVALAITRDGANFSRNELTRKAGISQDKWHKIKNDFLRLDYARPLPNNQNGYTLTPQDRRFLRGVKALPPPPEGLVG